MKRLIEKGLMFGNLIEITSPVLIDRYNRALKHLTGKTTELTDFHIDISGFSPEVGDDIGDLDYLNPLGCNRQFILLTTEQKTAPLLNQKFSMSRQILKDFIEANESQIFALTARDAVLGELENSVYELGGPARLWDIRTITVQADTTGAHVADAQALEEKITRFRKEPNAWYDDLLIAEMIGLAKKTGDVTRNPIALEKSRFKTGNFWTAHFGGVWVWHSPKALIVPGRPPKGVPRNVKLCNTRNQIAKFLLEEGLTEPIVQGKGSAAAAILRQKIDFILVDAAATLGMTDAHDRRALRRLAHTLGTSLPDEVRALTDLIRWAEAGGPWPEIGSDHPAFFYTLRARPDHPDRDIVNQLIATLSPLDIRQLFICHKSLFYDLYRSWPESKRAYVADFLEAEYMMDKAAARAHLFGPSEPEMVPEAPSRPRDPISAVGPWGAVSRARRNR